MSSVEVAASGLRCDDVPMPKIGDTVVTMSHVAPFTVVEIAGSMLTIVSAQGLRKQVLASNVRVLEKDPPVTS